MDGLSTAASIIAVIGLTAKIPSTCLEYGRNVKNAKTDIIRLHSELRNLEDILKGAKKLCEDPPTSNFGLLNKPLHNCFVDCTKGLSKLFAKLEPGNRNKWAAKIRLRALKWPFESKQIDQNIRRIAGHQETITLAFHINHRWGNSNL